MSTDIPPELPSYYNINDLPSLPSYSPQLVNGEQRLEYTPRPQAVRSRPSGVYVKKSGQMSVVLNDQEETVATPVFGRQAVINGTVLLSQEQLSSIRKIVLKVEGKLDSLCSAGGNQSITFINNSYTLWPHLTSQEPCLSQVPFSVRLPSTFQDGDNSFALPPSYHVQEAGVIVLLVRSVYQLHFIVTRARHRKLWLKEQCITIPFKYVPRTRPLRPMVRPPYFFSSLKMSPEEWHQAVTCLKMRPGFEMGPITCHLFIPAGRIYSLKDTIHFHIQLTGQTCSLHTLFSGTDLDRDTSTDSDSSVKQKNKRPFLRVTLLRQVTVAIRGETSCCNFVLGEGIIWPIPPDLCDATCQCPEGNIDWDGELRCRSEITTGGFNAANVHVQDFIILSVFPPTLKSPLLELELGIPVRLVTDSFSDIVTQMDAIAS